MSHGAVRKNCVSHMSVEAFHAHRRSVEFFKIHDTGILFANGGPGVSRFLKPRKFVSNIILPANRYTEFIWILSALAIPMYIAMGCGAAAPPNSPLPPHFLFFAEHGLLSRTSRYDEELRRSQNSDRSFQVLCITGSERLHILMTASHALYKKKAGVWGRGRPQLQTQCRSASWALPGSICVLFLLAG